MSDDDVELINAASIYLELDATGSLHVAFEKYQPEDPPSEEMQEYLIDVLAGVFGILSSQIEDVASAGRMVRATSDFEQTIRDGELDEEIHFEPAEELLEAIRGNEEETEDSIIPFPSPSKTKH